MGVGFVGVGSRGGVRRGREGGCCCEDGVVVGGAAAVLTRVGSSCCVLGSTCWAVWLKKRVVVAFVVVLTVGVGRTEGRSRVTGARSSSTERSNALLMAGFVGWFVFNWRGDGRVFGRRVAVSGSAMGWASWSGVENSVDLT